jgi:predicted MFS family arabinose efflux permease
MKSDQRSASSSNVGEDQTCKVSSLTSAHTSSPQNSETSPKVWPFLTGTLAARFANNGQHVTFPLLLLQFSDSLSALGFITAFTTGADTAGTLLGGWLSDRLHPRTVLVASTAVRSVMLTAIPILLVARWLNLSLVAGIYLLDSLGRGVADTARNTIPVALVGKDKNALDKLNSRYQTVFELGAMAGPFVAGGVLAGMGAVAANWLIPAAFATAAIVYLQIPKTTHPAVQNEQACGAPTLRNSISLVASNPGLRMAFIAIVLLTLYPPRGIFAALFAGSILKAPEQAAWLVGLFGVGALAGSVLYGRLHRIFTSPGWLRLGIAGLLVLAIGWIPGTFLPMALCIVLFTLSNVPARLSMVSTFQSQIPQGADGSVMGLTRFSLNLTSMVIRFMVGLAFAVVASPAHGFALVGVGIGIFAMSGLWVSRQLGEYVKEELMPKCFLASPSRDLRSGSDSERKGIATKA